MMLYRLVAKLQWWVENLRYREYRKKYDLHSSFKFNGKDIYFYGDGEIHTGERSYIGSLSTIQVGKSNKVVIGSGCSISHNVRMYTVSKVPDGDFKNEQVSNVREGDIIIEDYVWIGANVFINPGVKIGENSVVGANSVVTKDIAPNSICGGVPAKLIRMKKNYV